MQKIPTLLVRDPEDRRHVTDEVSPGCEWVLAGEGVPTRKYDGTCVAYIDDQWWARREVKNGRPIPEGFVQLNYDPETGKTIGWEPAGQSAFWKYLQPAIAVVGRPQPNSTYELVGPKVNGNPERYDDHRLIPHADAERLDGLNGSVDEIKTAVRALAEPGIEGVVWHHPDGRMAKLKVRDLR